MEKSIKNIIFYLVIILVLGGLGYFGAQYYFSNEVNTLYGSSQ